MTTYRFEVITYDNCGFRKTSVIGGDYSLPDALKVANREASYYFLGCDYPRVTIAIHEVCQKCGGTGQTGAKLNKRCTKCDYGTNPFIPEFPWELHPNVIEFMLPLAS